MTAAHMNGYQRDAVKTAIPGFKTSTHKGKSDRNLRTDELKPGQFVEATRKGFTLPTFEDLVRGLKRLPSGLDARGLSQCLSWYLNIRDTFNPKLELNVLHTQSLIRALRQPLKPYGPQNLDRNALEEWRSNGTFEFVEIENSEHVPGGNIFDMLAPKRSRLHLNLDNESVSMDLTLPIRHVLTLPFLALHGVVSEALKYGIDKADNRQEARIGATAQRSLEAKLAATAAAQADEEMCEPPDQSRWPTPSTAQDLQEHQAHPRIPKRPLPIQPGQLSVHKRAKPDTIPSQPSIISWPTLALAPPQAQPPTGPRAMISPQSSFPSHPPTQTTSFPQPRPIHPNLSWRAPSGSSSISATTTAIHRHTRWTRHPNETV